jgi:hypothetical protein
MIFISIGITVPRFEKEEIWLAILIVDGTIELALTFLKELSFKINIWHWMENLGAEREVLVNPEGINPKILKGD